MRDYIAEQFVQSFNLALPPCPIDGPFFHDHDHPKDVNSIRWRSDAGHQPSGTTYLGYFLSYKYFSSSEAQETGMYLSKKTTVEYYHASRVFCNTSFSSLKCFQFVTSTRFLNPFK